MSEDGRTTTELAAAIDKALVEVGNRALATTSPTTIISLRQPAFAALAELRSRAEQHDQMREERDRYKEWVARIWATAEQEMWDERAGPDDWALRIKRTYSERAEAAERERDHMRAALEGLANVAEQYMDTERGDLDGWIDRARSILAALSQPRNTQP